jgi:YesN/AraC family two-component response regulator
VEIGLHLKEYINFFKISRSKEFLRSGEDKVSDIAASVGILPGGSRIHEGYGSSR